MNFPQNPWTDPVVGHAFGSLATRLSYNGLRYFHPVDIKEFDPDNYILVDLRKNRNNIVNVTAVFYKTGHPTLADHSGFKTAQLPIINSVSIGHFNADVLVIFAPQKRTLGEKTDTTHLICMVCFQENNND